ncbi:MAG: hypothetical protein WD942_05340, partial [Dehalococcoidia bacterium]
VSIRMERDTNTAFVAVPDKQLSLAIGKEGQNARLAAQLTGRRIDIRAESALMQAGEDMYPPPEPNMEAIPIERPTASVAAGLAAPEQPMAPSQAAYAQPGLPGERTRTAPGTPVREQEDEEIRLTPEQEVLAEIIETEDEIDEPEAVEAETERPARTERPAAAAGGLRFAEEIREVQRLDDEGEETRGRDRRRTRRGSPTPATPARPARPARGGGRRFDLDDLDDDEIAAALHGDDFLDDEDEDDE